MDLSTSFPKGETVDSGLVMGDEFIKDPQERKTIMSQLGEWMRLFLVNCGGYHEWVLWLLSICFWRKGLMSIERFGFTT